MAMTIRIAKPVDLPAINAIYNHYVGASTCTYQEEPSTDQERRQWYDEHDKLHPITVAEVDGQVVAWGSLSRFHPRSAYGRTVENSVYVHHQWQRKGIGRAILEDLIRRGRELGHRSIIAIISADQIASVEIHRVLGFREAGQLKEVGLKFGLWLDVVYMQLML